MKKRQADRRVVCARSARRTFIRAAALSGIVLALLATGLHAEPVNFLFTGTGSGTLDNVPFSDRGFAVVISGDTDNINTSDPEVPFIDALNGTIEIEGLDVSAFVAPLYVFSNQTCVCLGFGNWVQFDLIDVDATGIGIETYDLTTSFGPIFTESPVFSQFQAVELNTGLLTFTAMSDVTFVAVVGEPVTFAGIADDIADGLQAGLIDNSGIARSLLAKLEAAADAMDRGLPETALQALQALALEVEAQAERHLSAEMAGQLLDGITALAESIASEA